MRHSSTTLWVVAVLLVAACSKKSEPAGAGTGTGTGTGTPAGVPAVVDAAPAPDASLLGDLPPLAIADADPATIATSIKLNGEGYAAHKKHDWAAAADRYRAAVDADPGNLLARYNLASVYVSSGEVDKGLALLAQFRQPDCRACAGILLHAATDHEWQPVRDDPRFTAAVTGVTAEPLDEAAVSKRIIAALRTGKPDGLEPYIHPRTPIKVQTIIYAPDQPPPTLHYGWPGFVELVGKGDRHLQDNGVRGCDHHCCHTGERGDSSYVVDKICFAGPGGVLFVSEIVYEEGPI